MKKALFFKKLKEKTVQCTLCPHFCVIKNLETGICNVRKNINGELYSTVFGKPVSLAIDPIEKKPLFHFFPGSLAFSFGTYGCNLDCKNCQNFEIAKGIPEDQDLVVSPKKIVELAKESKSKSIAYTYTEPTVFYEYVLETAKLAKKAGIKNVLVTNGFINKEPLLKLIPFIDAANIDLKGNEKHYVSICAGKQKPVLETIRLLHKKGIFIEITNLIIPSINDSDKDIQAICKFIATLSKNSKDIPLHFSAFFPTYKLTNLRETNRETLVRAKAIASKAGLNYVYLGNVSGAAEDTICPSCKKIVTKRNGFFVEQNDLKKGKCSCGKKIPGTFV